MKCPHFHAETLNEYERCLCRGVIPSSWRDVLEELPKRGMAVLVYCQYSSDEEYELDIAYIDNGWKSTTMGATIDVRYWAELPAPPEGVQG